jgi:hypothetical protein
VPWVSAPTCKITVLIHLKLQLINTDIGATNGVAQRMYIKDGYDGRDTVNAARSSGEFNMCVRYLRPEWAYLLKNRKSGQLHT